MKQITFRIVDVRWSDLTRVRNIISKKMANEMAENMRQRARTSLSPKSGTMYADNLRVGTTRDGDTPIYLTGWLPIALERGVEAYDMKPGFLNSPNVKVSKKGTKYLVVPIQAGSLAAPVKFRRVSQKSPAGSWLHPGLEARKFGSKAVDHIRDRYPADDFRAHQRENRGLRDML